MVTQTAEPQPTCKAEPVGTAAAREIVRRLFSGVDARLDVSLEDGTALRQHPEPKATIILREPSVLRALLTRSSDLVAGEAVVRGDIRVKGDVEAAFGIMDDVAAAREPQEWPALVALALRLPASKASQAEPSSARPKLRGRLHSLERDRAAIAHHYDVSNEFYALWLDRNMTYSCAYFRDPSITLDEAQLDKYELICRKLRLQQNERFLDVGCGWGGLIRFAAREYGVTAVGITLSARQAEFARERIAEEHLDKCCRVELVDYRDLQALGEFNKAASVGMVEHVGDPMLLKYFESVYAALAPGGIFLNHGIISQKPRISGLRALAGRFFPQRSRFIETYVFPDGELPRLPEMTQAAQDAGFEVRDVENLREHYTQTLRHWVERLEEHEEEARRLVGDATYNTWRFYMAGSAHGFKVGKIGVVQQLLAKRHADGTADVPMTRADIYH
ncbi:MAG: class I SAM-dependent methyltransferase [Candidatus Eremiobacteraeota bacterium]|nr:class I SAM-dependent methyltransferase [Candidatus Eremiobacteraeota bacterium]